MTFFSRVWTRAGLVYTVNTTSKFLELDTFTGWSDEIFDLEIDGDYQDAEIVMPKLSVQGGTIVGDGLSLTVTRVRPGIPQDVQAELAAMREGLSLSFAQLLTGLVTEAWISETEGLAWLGGTLPSPVQSLISTLPAEQRFAATARAIAPSTVLRNDSLVVALGANQGKTPEELDQFFITYSQV